MLDDFEISYGCKVQGVLERQNYYYSEYICKKFEK